MINLLQRKGSVKNQLLFQVNLHPNNNLQSSVKKSQSSSPNDEDYDSDISTLYPSRRFNSKSSKPRQSKQVSKIVKNSQQPLITVDKSQKDKEMDIESESLDIAAVTDVATIITQEQLNKSPAKNTNNSMKERSNQSMQLIEEKLHENREKRKDTAAPSISSFIHPDYPLQTIEDYSFDTDSETIIKDSKLKYYDTPGEGNCAIQGLMHHMNIAKKMNVDIYDLENVALFRQFLCTKVMEMFLDDSIEHIDGKKEVYLASIWSDQSLIFSRLYSFKNHKNYKKIGRLPQRLWVDHEILLPLIAFVSEKSTVFNVIKHEEKSI